MQVFYGVVSGLFHFNSQLRHRRKNSKIELARNLNSSTRSTKVRFTMKVTKNQVPVNSKHKYTMQRSLVLSSPFLHQFTASKGQMVYKDLKTVQILNVGSKLYFCVYSYSDSSYFSELDNSEHWSRLSSIAFRQ